MPGVRVLAAASGWSRSYVFLRRVEEEEECSRTLILGPAAMGPIWTKRTCEGEKDQLSNRQLFRVTERSGLPPARAPKPRNAGL